MDPPLPVVRKSYSSSDIRPSPWSSPGLKVSPCEYGFTHHRVLGEGLREQFYLEGGLHILEFTSLLALLLNSRRVTPTSWSFTFLPHIQLPCLIQSAHISPSLPSALLETSQQLPSSYVHTSHVIPPSSADGTACALTLEVSPSHHAFMTEYPSCICLVPAFPPHVLRYQTISGFLRLCTARWKHCFLSDHHQSYQLPVRLPTWEKQLLLKPGSVCAGA